MGGVEERYNLSDALAVATYLNGFIRHCRTVRIANLAQLVNAIAPIFTSPQGLFLQTIYHPLRLYAEHMPRVRARRPRERRDLRSAVRRRRPRRAGASTACRTWGRSRSSTRRRPRDAAGRQVTLAVVNRDRDRRHRGDDRSRRRRGWRARSPSPRSTAPTWRRPTRSSTRPRWTFASTVARSRAGGSSTGSPRTP